jgi:hypothetical protein
VPLKKQSSDSHRLHDLKFVVATRMLDHIGVNMYSKYPKAIAELVVNGYDADATYVTIDIKRAPKQYRGESTPDMFDSNIENVITIEDNGEGMSERDIREGYMFLGSGQKRVVKRTPLFHRLPIGNKGIGKLAGFGIAKRIEVRTIKNGIGYEFVLDRDSFENSEKMGKLQESILDRVPIQLSEFDAKGQTNGTRVNLRHLRPEIGKIDSNKLIEHLAHDLPLGKDFKVMVDGRQCRSTQIPASRRIQINYESPIFGKIIGEIVVAKEMLKKPGVFTTVRGRIVGDSSLFDISPTSFTYHVCDLITGQIEVEGFDPEELVDEISVIKTDREGFVETHPKYIAYRRFITEQLAIICKEEEKKREAKADEEKKVKIDEAIKQVTEDINAYDELLKRKARQDNKLTGFVSEDGQTVLQADLDIETKQELDRHRDHKPEQPLLKEVKALLGPGKIKFKNQSYDIKIDALGVDYFECDIRTNESLIIINMDHPTYEQGIREKCIEIVAFRAIAARFALIDSKFPEELYKELDQMIRFQATRMRRRKNREEHLFEIGGKI